jgi:hypothetical protein
MRVGNEGLMDDVIEPVQGNDDLCTPEWLLGTVRKMGPIALDPCSNPWSKVGARISYSLHNGQDGLKRDWFTGIIEGSLWLNPPYSKPGPWIDKLVSMSWLEGPTDRFALVKNDPSTKWFRRAMESAVARADFSRRIRFDGGKHNSGTLASTLFYWGPSPYLFCHLFAPHGDVFVLRWNR